jgi:hypothetical protein
VEVVGEITHVMAKSELSQFKSKVTEDGTKLYRGKYEREVWLGAREGTLKFRVVRNGKELGSTTISFSND